MSCPSFITNLPYPKYLKLLSRTSWTVGAATFIGIAFFGLPKGTILIVALVTASVLIALGDWRDRTIEARLRQRAA